jgi:hypothetical protein
VSEATGASIEALGIDRGHRTLVVIAKRLTWDIEQNFV